MDTLNNLEQVILGILGSHEGKGFAISGKDLVEKVNTYDPQVLRVSEREIRATMKHLTTQHGYAIGSNHSGYFMAVSSQEIDEVAKYYEGYGLSSFFVASKLKKIEMREYLGQLSMKFGG